MVWSPVAWAYKQVVTSAKLQQMVDNIVAHDHRADGTQGAPLMSGWTPVTGIVRAVNWGTVSARYRRLDRANGSLVLLEVTATRLNSDLRFGSSGNVVDTPVLSGMPAALRPVARRYLRGQYGGVALLNAYLNTTGQIGIGSGQTNASVPEGGTITIGDLLWLD